MIAPKSLDLFLRSQAALANDNFLGAARALVDLSGERPSDLALRIGAVQAAIEAGLMDDAVRLARLIKPDELHLEGRLLLLAADFRDDQPGRALALFPEGLGDASGGFMKTYARAWAAHLKGEDGDAIMASVPNDSPLFSAIGEQRAYLALINKRTDLAMAMSGQALRFSGARADQVGLAIAQGLAANGRKDAAAALVEGFAHFGPELLEPGAPQHVVADAGDALAQLYLNFATSIAASPDGDKSLILALSRMAMMASPERDMSRMAVAMALTARERHDDAIETLAAKPFPKPLDLRADDLHAQILSDMGRHEDAIRVARKAALTDDSPQAAARVGTAYLEADRLQDAVTPFVQAVNRADATKMPNRWVYRLMLGDVLSRLDRWDEARKVMLTGLLNSPDNPLLLNYVGYGDVEAGMNLETAEAMIRRAHNMQPQDPSITDSLGWALYKMGRKQEAVELLQSAVERDSGQAEILEHLGDVLWSLGRQFEARYRWQAALLLVEGEEKARIEAKLADGLNSATAAP